NEEIKTRNANQIYILYLGVAQADPAQTGAYRIPVYSSDNSTYALVGCSFNIQDLSITGITGGQIQNNDYVNTNLVNQNGGIDLAWVSESNGGQSINTNSPIFYINVSNLPYTGSFNLPTLNPNSELGNTIMKSNGVELDIEFALLPSAFTNSNESKIFVTPIPTKDALNLLYFSEKSTISMINIFNNRSNENKIQSRYVLKGWNNLYLDINDYVPGMYIVQINNGVNIKTAKILKN
ncbi:MAG: hypothetical protein ABIO44_10935, partial [Saprospiraceae bacterium]